MQNYPIEVCTPDRSNSDDSEPKVLKNLKEALSTQYSEAALTIVEQTINGSLKSSSNQDNRVEAIYAMLLDLAPKDPAESMLAAQMITVHFQAVDLMRQATFCSLPESRQLYLNLATKLMGTYTRQMDALRKSRLKGRQEIRVEHVNINGGHNILGSLTNNGG